MLPVKKLPAAIKILRRDGFRQLGESIASYYSPEEDPVVEPHLQMLQHREDLIIAEIGVWEGDNAHRLCDILDIEKMYLIDPYDRYEEWNFPHAHHGVSEAEMESKNKLEEYDFIRWIKDYSNNAVECIEESLDYVYIDGNHSYEFVKSDLENYYELMADDGIIAGDDMHFSGVAQAVTEFAVERDLQPHFEKDTPDWYFIKDRNPNPSVDYVFTPKDVYDSLDERR